MRRPRILLTTITIALLAAGGSMPLAKPAAAVEWAVWQERAIEVVSDTADTTVDLLVLRPLSVGRLVIGAGVMMPISSFFNAATYPLGRDPKIFSEDWDKFVVEPTEYLFVRPIGEDLAGL